MSEDKRVRLDDFESIPSREPGVPRVQLDEFVPRDAPLEEPEFDQARSDSASDRGASPSPSGDRGRKRIRLIPIGEVDSKRIVWLEKGLIARGMLTGLLAPGGTAKGLYSVHLAAKLARREEKTLFLCSEDALNYIVRPRFEAAGCDGRLAFALDLEDDCGRTGLRFPADLPLLAEGIERVQPALAVVDPILSYIDPGLDLGKNNQMRAILQPLIELALESEAAIMPVYHLGKDHGRGAIGSVAFEDACRSILTIARDDEDEDLRHLELTKSNIGPTGYGRKLRIVEVPIEIEGETAGVAKLVDEGRSNKSVAELLAIKHKTGPDPTQREQARQVLSGILVDAAPGSVNAGEAKKLTSEKTGASGPTVWRAFTELKEDGLVGGSPVRDDFGTIVEWRWFARPELVLGRGDA